MQKPFNAGQILCIYWSFGVISRHLANKNQGCQFFMVIKNKSRVIFCVGVEFFSFVFGTKIFLQCRWTVPKGFYLNFRLSSMKGCFEIYSIYYSFLYGSFENSRWVRITKSFFYQFFIRTYYYIFFPQFRCDNNQISLSLQRKEKNNFTLCSIKLNWISTE